MDFYQAEYKLILEEGLATEEELLDLRKRVTSTGISPLNLLAQDGLISPSRLELTLSVFSGETSTEGGSTQTGKSHFKPPTLTRFPLENWDRFQITGFLGQGGMGRVFKAYDPRLDRVVAIKLLNRDSAMGHERFVKEARFQAVVRHPHVCQIHEAGMVAEWAYIAMQYIEGQDLKLATENMDLSRKLMLFQQIAAGLHLAHREGLIHRDIKPGNIMVEDADKGAPHAYILDFGLARDQKGPQMSQTGDLMGTPAGTSPGRCQSSRSKIRRIQPGSNLLHRSIRQVGGAGKLPPGNAEPCSPG